MKTRASRDPEARRRTIVEAAASVIVEVGINELTHRKVAARAQVPLGSTTHYFASLDELLAAALQLLGRQIDDDHEGLRRALAGGGDLPRIVAHRVSGYLADRFRVRTETAFYVAGIQHRDLRPLTGRWFQGLVNALTPYVDVFTARSIALYLDGVMLQVALHEAPVAEDELAEAIARLMKGSND